MTTRRDVLKTIAAAGVAATFIDRESALAAKTGLNWKHFPAGENGFFRAPVLITGAREAVLIDGGFTFPDGKALAEAIKLSPAIPKKPESTAVFRAPSRAAAIGAAAVARTKLPNGIAPMTPMMSGPRPSTANRSVSRKLGGTRQPWAMR